MSDANTIAELIEKHLESHEPEELLDDEHLRGVFRQFAVELLENIEPTREQAREANGCFFRALDKNYWKALEELKK